MSNPTSLSILFYTKNDKTDKNGLVPIYYRITIDGKRTEGSINKKVDADRWDSSSGYVKGKKEDIRTINAHIDTVRNKIHEIHRDMLDHGEFITSKVIKNKLVGIDKRHKTILEVFKYHNNQMKELEGKDFATATVKRYDTTYNHISDFIEYEYGTNDMYLKQMDYSFVTNLEKYFKVVKNCNHNTSIKYIKNFKKVIHLAIANDWLDKDPFLKYKVTLEESNREFLSQEELSKIENKELHIPRLEVVRDVFIFSCYTGLAYVDVANLTPENIVIGIDSKKWIYSFREKTGVKSNIPLLPKALEIIERYKDHPESILKGKLLPISSNQKTNAYLKEIATLCGISRTNLSFHVARHTYATWLLTMGVSMETVSALLSHKSIKSTQIYGKIITKRISNEMTQLTERLTQANNNSKTKVS